MSPIFSPPTANELPSILPETTGLQRRLFRHFGGNPVGHTVMRSGATFVTVPTPYAEDLEGLLESVDYFLGGHIYEVSDAVAVELAAAGYDVHAPSTWGSWEDQTWGSLDATYWGGE